MNVLMQYSVKDIDKLFRKKFNGFEFVVNNDGTAGVNVKDKKQAKECMTQFSKLGFGLVPDKYLAEVQKIKHDFYVFYSIIKQMEPSEQDEAKQYLLKEFSEVEIKKTGEFIVTIKGTDILSYSEEVRLKSYMEKRTNGTTRLIKRTRTEAKFLGKWQIK